MKATLRFGLFVIIILMLTAPVMAGQPGTLKWAFPTGGKVSSSPALSKDGIIYVGSEDGKVYAINPDGTKKWEFSTTGSITRSPMISDKGIIYISSADGKLYAINPNGTSKWVVEFGEENYIENYALGRYQTIYLSLIKSIRNCYLYAIDPSGKAKLLQTLEEINGGPAIGPDGTVYLSGWESWTSRIFAFYSYGSRKWDFPMSPYSKVDEPVAVARDGTIYAATSSWGGHMLYAINPTGSQKWAFDIEEGAESSPVIDVHGTIYVKTNMLYAINPNGSMKWSKPYSGPPVLGADGAIYTSMEYSKPAALNADGSEKWVSNIDVWLDSFPPVLAPDGTLYYSGRQSNPPYETKLYAVYSDSPGLANSDWPMYQHDPQHTGSAQLPYLRPDLSPVIMLLQD